jgi:hypothetical protein
VSRLKHTGPCLPIRCQQFKLQTTSS